MVALPGRAGNAEAFRQVYTDRGHALLMPKADKSVNNGLVES